MDYIFRFLALFFFVTLSGQSFASELSPIEILDPIEFQDTEIKGEITQSEISVLYNLPVSMGGNKTDGVELTSPDEAQKETLSTCAQYKAHNDKDWFAGTTYDLSMESFFKSTCGRLDILSKSSPSKTSQFESAPYHLNELQLYPAEMLTPITTARGSLCEGAKTLEECAKQRNGKVTLKDTQLHFTDESYEAHFTPSVKADINNDGFEDMIFDYAYYAIGGTFRSYGQICLEWPEGQESISVIDCGIE